MRNTACSIHGCSMYTSTESGPLNLFYTLHVQMHHRLVEWYNMAQVFTSQDRNNLAPQMAIHDVITVSVILSTSGSLGTMMMNCWTVPSQSPDGRLSLDRFSECPCMLQSSWSDDAGRVPVQSQLVFLKSQFQRSWKMYTQHNIFGRLDKFCWFT